MSGDISKREGSSRSKIVVAVAVMAAAVMLAVPFSVAFDSEAKAKEESAGYYVEGVNATDEDLNALDLETLYDSLFNDGEQRDGIMMYLAMFFNIENFDMSSLAPTAKTYTVSSSEGVEVSESGSTRYASYYSNGEGIKVVFNTETEGDIINPAFKTNEKLNKEDREAAIKAITDYLGETYKVGDKVIITGDFTAEFAMLTYEDYESVEGNTNVVTKLGNELYMKFDMDFEIELIKSGEESGKKIRIVSDSECYGTGDVPYDFGDKKISDLKEGDTVKVSRDVSSSSDFNVRFDVDGKKYGIDNEVKLVTDDAMKQMLNVFIGSKTDEAEVKFLSDEVLGASVQDVKETIALLPAQKDTTTVKKEFSDAKSAFNDVKKDVKGEKKTNFIPYVVGGVAAVIIIAGIAFFLIKRK